MGNQPRRPDRLAHHPHTSLGRTEFTLLHLEELPLSTSYVEAPERIVSMCRNLLDLRHTVPGGRNGPGLYTNINSNGVGQPMLDLDLAFQGL